MLSEKQEGRGCYVWVFFLFSSFTLVIKFIIIILILTQRYAYWFLEREKAGGRRWGRERETDELQDGTLQLFGAQEDAASNQQNHPAMCSSD